MFPTTYDFRGNSHASDHTIADDARLGSPRKAEQMSADLSRRLDRVVDDQLRPRITVIVADRIRAADEVAGRTDSLVVPVQRTREGGVQKEQEADHFLRQSDSFDELAAVSFVNVFLNPPKPGILSAFFW